MTPLRQVLLAALVVGGAACGTAGDSEESTLPVSVAPTTIDPGVGFVFDALTDITLFPRANYDVSPCDRRDVGTTEPGGMIDFGPSDIDDFDELVANFDVIALVTVLETLEPLTFTPIELPESYAQETGITDGEIIQWNATPVIAEIEDVLSGLSISSGNFLEIGCFDPDTLPSTTAGESLLVFATRVDPGLGPDTGVPIELRIADWMSTTAQGDLAPRIGLFGAPPLAPFLVGQQRDAVITALQTNTE